MYLKRLEISGFKSFADKSILEFKKGVSAIVGPNGSGKSNVADAIRWVMGEQGMKALRSKKGEDLIFSGSQKKNAVSKASVSLHFDNRDKVFPLEFNEISISRKIFRDGENQYLINDSQVRLKDILELIAKAKLGLRGYTIINQGMGDFILSAPPSQRREIFEDALGLREFQLKKTEAKNKLEQTKTNLAQTQNLVNEIAPHLRFLKKQAEKIQQKDVLEKQLRDNELKYFKSKLARLSAEKNELSKAKEDIQRIIAEEEGFAATVKESIAKNEEHLESFFQQESALEKQLEEIASKKSALERELGKIEGMLAVKGEMGGNASYEAVDLPYLNSALVDIYRRMKEALGAGSLEDLRHQLDFVLNDFDRILSEIKSGRMTQTKQKSQIVEKEPLFSEKEKVTRSLAVLENQLKSAQTSVKDLNNAHRAEKDKLFGSKKELYERGAHLDKLKEQLANFDFRIIRVLADMEVVKQESKFIENFCDAAIESTSHIASPELDSLKNDIEKLRMRLEMMENIDPEIQKEYEETQKRYEFLTKESGDLTRALVSLEEVIVNLEQKIDTMFNEAFVKIDAEFNRYFNMLFDGGRARLIRISEKRRAKSEELEENQELEEVTEEGGIDIKVDMPRKKIKDIHMLSGGERALTSIALIFALVSCSPPPFLVIDEVDAPLDESNALRFARILEELRGKTQFIVITHNRETMKQADVLYGVTMGNDGISKLFSLKLDEILKSS